MSGLQARLGAIASRLGGLIAGGVLLWFVAFMVLPVLPAMATTRWRLRPPDWDLLFGQSPAILIHLAAALLAFVLGLVQLIGVKGTRVHRVLGWTWVVAMGVTAVSSLFIRQINSGAFSFIHLLSGLTLIALPMGVHAARRHDVGRHAREMRGLFVGALIIAGVLALLPGRLIWRVFFG